jgi:hypothetical protein
VTDSSSVQRASRPSNKGEDAVGGGVRRPPLVERESHLDVDHPRVRVVDDVADEHLHVLGGAEGVAVAGDVLLDGPLDPVGGRLGRRGAEDLHPSDVQTAEPVELPPLDLAVEPQHHRAPAVAQPSGIPFDPNA